MRDLLDVAADRSNLFPLLKDAREPETYAHVVEPVDVIVQDVAIRGQADVALANRQFLREDGRLVLSVKARSEDVTRDPQEIFTEVRERLSDGYDIAYAESLEPFHDDHLGIVAMPQ
jgi:fibrillarin-like pre-rRNA processing protein